MKHELAPGDYALMHANGASWAEVLAEHRAHVQMDDRDVFTLRSTTVEVDDE